MITQIHMIPKMTIPDDNARLQGQMITPDDNLNDKPDVDPDDIFS
jgi:hypothetical protein